MKDFLVYQAATHGILWGFTFVGYLMFSFIELNLLPIATGNDLRFWELGIIFIGILVQMGFRE